MSIFLFYITKVYFCRYNMLNDNSFSIICFSSTFNSFTYIKDICTQYGVVPF